MAPKPEFGSTFHNPKVTNADSPVAALHAHLLHIAQITTDTNAKLDQLIQLMIDQRVNQPRHRRRRRRHRAKTIRTSAHLKSSFPPLTDPTHSIGYSVFQAENYFMYYAIAPPQHLSLAVFYFTGDALSWYKYLTNNRLLGTWEEFSRALELRFGPSIYENHQATLFKLHQTTTVSAYQSAFEKLSNRVTDLGSEALLNCFLSGLRADIQNEIAIHHPTSLHQAYGLAKLVEDKLHGQFESPAAPINPPPPTPPLLAAPPSAHSPLPIKKLNPAEMQKRRAKGLCYYCPAVYKPGHQCTPPKFLLLQSEKDPQWPYNLGLEDKACFEDGSIDTIP
ncbi:hypothetical protein LXL04_022332 [Taraxacum kok-saghyz]